MTVPKQFSANYIPIKYFLSSFRALSDGRGGIRHLKHLLTQPNFLLSEWKIVWIGTCTTLRSAIDLFRVDSRSCLDSRIRDEINVEWKLIKADPSKHQIYWEFLKKERDNIIHEYKWSAYEAWLSPDGEVQAPPSILGGLLGRGDGSPIILMRNGFYKGQDSCNLLEQAADWVQDRIFAAIGRAGYDPDEKRGASNFERMPETNLKIIGPLAAQFNAKA
ncbi:hypothetical protein [Alteraurantiacibacter buctensis]|uniref:Uncharacterized protein n=1 Tax=Alteraurantiacibacter buctensis TaxID=1503981 RepID=A0A844YTC5_9SPHN|nr:hypothetical protein [Alteraurantiacibacter buctensis]MXO71575.1 hypothetical protein [Alteraurantiacibacter buctensis]